MGEILSVAERLSDRVSMIESLFACDREVQDKERSKIIRNKLCFIDKWLSCQLRVYFSLTIQSSSVQHRPVRE